MSVAARAHDRREGRGPRPEDALRRVWVDAVRPCIDGGRFPVKRVMGESVSVTADVLVDGHDERRVVLQWRAASDPGWRETPMRALGNDVFAASFVSERLEPYEYTVVAWIDRFGSWRHELEAKVRAGRDVASELLEGAQLVAEAAERADGTDHLALEDAAERLRARTPAAERIGRALAAELVALMERHPDRANATSFERVLRVTVERPVALAGAWYEFFPRSVGPAPGQHGTFRDAERMLPYVARMGFDVVYLPPVHPIGRTNRKGRNNALEAGPDDPGSPWAIGAREGGHTAVHPQLGTLEDFDRFVAAARAHGLEVALDIAFQCAPDHPYVREHPEWFRQRPDGTIKYAENPPKKYEDIHPLDFECADWQGLWRELLHVGLFWCQRGVRLFRVDNPHTKPLRFWEWWIAEIRQRYPDAVFLSEAFTRPKLMYALAKVGFSQSYTYFTWRNTKWELEQYLHELTRTDVKEVFRPNFFTNTPDINPQYLQFGGRPAFFARAVLAATLSASWGVYSGFELCEAESVNGREEYRDSEKYELRAREWDHPDSLRPLLTLLNTIRRENPALLRNDGLRFYPCDNDQLLWYGKSTPDGANTVLVVVNLDPHHVQHGFVEVPLEELGIDPHDTYQMHDLVGGGRYLWQGRRNYVRLSPWESQAQIFRLRRRVRTERDFDYFM
jgi:starch synthase (maltosyl-transferring)